MYMRIVYKPLNFMETQVQMTEPTDYPMQDLRFIHAYLQ